MLSNVNAQFAPQAGTAGTTAIHKDSSAFKAWATACTLQLGWQNIADTTLGKAQVGDASYVIGKAGSGVASLGDGGVAILSFEHPIINGEGYDFAVFENGFIDQTLAPGTAFLEIAFVEVSSDGVNYTRFPATCLTDTAVQIAPYQGTVAANLNNLAGKYIGNFGTPFDLEELDSIEGLNINYITHVKIIDVVGSIQNAYATRDTYGNKVNDPWPTDFASSGFDLDAVGVIHHDITQSLKNISHSQALSVFPNPAAVNEAVFIGNTFPQSEIAVYDLLGNKTSSFTVTTVTNGMEFRMSQTGMYLLVAKSDQNVFSKRIVITN